MEEYKPYFMCDNTEKDGHAETIMDYVLSWCLRCTKYPFVKDNKPILYQYCKYMLCKLIDRLQDMNNIEIGNVRVWKQERYIDLWVEVDMLIDKREEHHAILIEDKYYTGVHDDQLNRYKQIFDDYYNGQKDKYPENNRHYALVTCIYDVDSNYEALQEAIGKVKPFNIYHLYDLADDSLNYKESESDIYNEIFIRHWV